MPRRMTMSTRNIEAVKASLRQYGENAKARAKVVVKESADRLYAQVESLAPVDTGYMRDHIRKEFTPAGLGYQVGFRESDFPGGFYPLYVIFGTRTMAARDFLFGPAAVERPRFRAALAEALRNRGKAA